MEKRIADAVEMARKCNHWAMQEAGFYRRVFRKNRDAHLKWARVLKANAQWEAAKCASATPA